MSRASFHRECPAFRSLVPLAALCLTAMLGATARATVVVADPGNPAAPTSTTASMTAGGVAIPVKTESLPEASPALWVSDEVASDDFG